MTTLTLQPSQIDSYVSGGIDGSPDTNFGSATFLRLGMSIEDYSTYRAFIKFDLSTLPDNATISSAKMSLFLQANEIGGYARTYRVYRQKRAWTEAGVTWNKYDGTNAWQSAGGFGADDC